MAHVNRKAVPTRRKVPTRKRPTKRKVPTKKRPTAKGKRLLLAAGDWQQQQLQQQQHGSGSSDSIGSGVQGGLLPGMGARTYAGGAL